MHVHCHSWFSLRYGLMQPRELLTEAQNAGITTLALTDINNTSAHWDFVRLAPEYGIRPVVGIDFRNKGDDDGLPLYIGLANNPDGYARLCAHLNRHLNEHQSFSDVVPEIQDVAFICPWERWKARLEDSADLQSEGNEWIGVRPWEQSELRLMAGNPVLKNRIPWERLIALHTFTFRHKRDWNCHRILRAVDRNELLSRLPKTATGHAYDRVLSPANFYQTFAEFPEWVERSEALLNACSAALPIPEYGRFHNNQHTYTESEDSDEQLIRVLCAEGLAYRYPDHEESVLERMEMELRIIRQQGYLSYFLINWDITSYARSKGYFYVGRGSGANSLVAYLLRITDVDPIELDLYFERFINLYRTNPPDFDIDFSWTDRDDVTAYIFKRFPHVALVGAYSTFQYRAVVRELGKVFGLPKHDIDRIADGKINPVSSDEMEHFVVRYAGYLQDFPNALTIHACGVLIADRPLHHFGGTFMPPKGFPTTQYDMVVAEDIGLYKFDILSQRGLGKIRDTIDMIAEDQPEVAAQIDIHDMSRFKRDSKVQSMLRNALAVGCFYVESPAMRMLMRKLQVDNYLGLVAASSVIRPGVARSGMMKAYIERHRDPEKRSDAHPVLMELMPETYGVMVYQEDVIKVAHHFAGMDLGEADVLRRGMSGKFRSREEFAKARETFILKALDKGRKRSLVEEVWRQVESFAGYAFAKGHSASYAVESYQSLFLKAHWPLQYMAACINNFGGFYRTEFYVHEARMVGGRIEAPCLNRGGWEACVDAAQQRIYLGFNLVRGAQAQTVANVIEERDAHGAYQSLEDCIERNGIALEQCLILIRCGGFRFTGKDAKQLQWEAHFLLGQIRKGQEEATLFTPDISRFTLPEFEHNELEMAFDQIELFGFPLVSPFRLLTSESARQLDNAVRSEALSDCIGKTVDVIGYLVTVKETQTARRERMAFGCFVDVEGQWIDTVHFPPSLKQYGFRGRGIYRIRGPVREEFNCLHVEALFMEKLAYISDPRYSEDGLPVPKARPNNASASQRRSTIGARSGGGMLKRSMRTG
ncbi:MAG: DNA polymerase III subunit alpha [Flavobacteriales bacterium]|nr:DNA polymerase III subunit alpha [Flavobacteriales bacterium]